VIHGMADDVVPFKTTVDLAAHLSALGKDFDLAVGPRATHAWTRGPDARYLVGKLVQHLERHLALAGKGDAARKGTAPAAKAR